MSTRCQIGFYEKEGQPLDKWNVLLYRHSDGYPGKADGSEAGVLADIVPYIKAFMAKRGFDIEYLPARLLEFMCRTHGSSGGYSFNQVRIGEIETGIYIYGICTEIHGDIEYFYAIYPNRIEVYGVPFGKPPRNWTEVESISLS